MKRPIDLFLLLSLFLSLCIASCSDKNEDVFVEEIEDTLLTITSDQTELESSSVGDSLTFSFTLKGIEVSQLKVKSSETWCKPNLFENQEKGKIITQANNTALSRSATITLFYEKTSSTFKVTQQPRAKAPDVKDDVKLTVSGGKASAYNSWENIEKSFDNDKSTMYHSPYDASLITPENPIVLTYNFSNVGVMDYLIYHPRNSGVNGVFKTFDLYVSYDNQSTYEKIGGYDFSGYASPTLLSFPTPLNNPTHIKFEVAGGVGNYVSCAEMEFYRKNDHATFDYSAYFADKVCSELKHGITLTEINSISDVFFRELALDIYRNTYHKEFRVQEYKQYQYPEVMANQNKTSTYSLLDNPTGIALKSGEVFTVIADLKGQSASLTSIDLGIGYSTGAENYILKDGVNKFTAPKNGLLYVKYHTNDKTGTKANIKLHIIGGGVNGYFDSQKHTENDWRRLLDQAVYKDFDVLGKYAHITFSTEKFRANTPSGKELIDQYDQLVYLEQEFMGLVKYNRMYQNRLYFHVDYPTTMHMYATSYRTAYEEKTMDMLTTLSSFKASPWGPAHEVGHINQTRPAMRWFGMTEVTNNIHSLYVQTSFGNTSTLIKDSRYSQALSRFVNKNIAHHEINDSENAGVYNGVFHKLIPFWQLKLYLVDALGKKDFYKDLYELYRTTNYTPSGTSTVDGFYQLKFVENVCKVANLDLTDFFQSWGFLTAVDTKGIMDKDTPFKVTQADVDATKKRIAEKNYKKPSHDNIYEITDNNVANYK